MQQSKSQIFITQNDKRQLCVNDGFVCNYVRILFARFYEPHKIAVSFDKNHLFREEYMKLIRKTALTLALGVATATTATAADELTIAIVNNGHMINMQKVAEAYTADTGVKLNWVSLEEGVLREQVTSDTATGGGEYDIINIGMQEAPIWGAAGWIEPLNFGADYDVDDMLPAMRNGLSHEGTLYAAPFYGESSMVMLFMVHVCAVSLVGATTWRSLPLLLTHSVVLGSMQT